MFSNYAYCIKISIFYLYYTTNRSVSEVPATSCWNRRGKQLWRTATSTPLSRSFGPVDRLATLQRPEWWPLCRTNLRRRQRRSNRRRWRCPQRRCHRWRRSAPFSRNWTWNHWRVCPNCYPTSRPRLLRARPFNWSNPQRHQSKKRNLSSWLLCVPAVSISTSRHQKAGLTQHHVSLHHHSQ